MKNNRIGWNAVVINLFWPMDHLLKKYLIDHFAMMTSQEQLVETVLHIGQ